ncbi:MAG: VOC family protein [Pseudomonadota bacterium]
MTAMRLDHVNVRTGRLAEMVRWYADVVGLSEGWRPPFPFPGAWLYAGDDAVLHLIGVDGSPQAGGDIALEHFALAAGGGAELEAFRARLAAAGVTAEERRVPGTDILQLNLHDPDGTHIHVDFRTG